MGIMSGPKVGICVHNASSTLWAGSYYLLSVPIGGHLSMKVNVPIGGHLSMNVNVPIGWHFFHSGVWEFEYHMIINQKLTYYIY